MKQPNTSVTLTQHGWRQFKKNRPAYISLWVLCVLIGFALLAPLLANDKPLYIKLNGENYFPALSFSNSILIKNEKGVDEKWQTDVVDWKQLEPEKVVWCLVAYSPNKSDLLNADYVSPNGNQLFKNNNDDDEPMPTAFWHWLGTNKRGEDVLSGLIYGTRISLSIGILSMSIASLIGIFLGALAGYFGDDKFKTTRGMIYFSPFAILVAYFYAFTNRSFQLKDALAISTFQFLFQFLFSLLIAAAVLLGFYFFVKKIVNRISFFNQQKMLPVDSIISRIIEIIISLPTLILIISVAAIAKPSLLNLMLIIGCVQWTGIARLTRAEILKIKNLDYMQASQALGYGTRRIIFRHALPNAIAPALVSIAFGVASAILIESGLSFLGIGVPADTVTWGSLINSGRENFSAWWLVLFPGLMIFITVTAYNLIGEGLRDAIDPRLKK